MTVQVWGMIDELFSSQRPTKKFERVFALTLWAIEISLLPYCKGCCGNG